METHVLDYERTRANRRRWPAWVAAAVALLAVPVAVRVAVYFLGAQFGQRNTPARSSDVLTHAMYLLKDLHRAERVQRLADVRNAPLSAT